MPLGPPGFERVAGIQIMIKDPAGPGHSRGFVEPAVFLIAFVTLVGTVGFTIVRVAKMITSRREAAPELAARVEALEQEIQNLQQGQAETLERLDFAERLLSERRNERQIGG